MGLATKQLIFGKYQLNTLEQKCIGQPEDSLLHMSVSCAMSIVSMYFSMEKKHQLNPSQVSGGQ